MRSLLVSTIIILIFFSACTKRDDVTPNELDYYPTGKDSKWVYASSNGVTFDIQALGDTIIEGNNYARLGDVKDMYPGLVRKENGRYYSRYNLYGIYREERIFLQDNLPKRATWTFEKFGDKELYTIISKDNKRTIDGKEYNNTIEVKREFYNMGPNGEFTLGFTEWTIYAKGIGLIASSLDQNLKFSLTEYEIK
jgi:hypothetical protein